MTQTALRVGLAVALVATAAVAPLPAGDGKSKAPDWSGYAFVSDVTGEVVKADDQGVTLRVTWLEAQPNGRPRLSSNNRNFLNPFAPSGNRPRMQLKEQHHDYQLEFVAESLVRTKALPPKLDDKGKKVPHTQAEIDELRSPDGVRGYAASRSDLTPGTIAELILVRDKAIPAAKAGEDDLRVKYAIILGRDPNPPKDIVAPEKKTDDKTKKN